MALLAYLDFNMIVTFFALGRLAYTPMMISPTLSGSECLSLLKTVGCETIIYGLATETRAVIDQILRKENELIRLLILLIIFSATTSMADTRLVAPV